LKRGPVGKKDVAGRGKASVGVGVWGEKDKVEWVLMELAWGKK